MITTSGASARAFYRLLLALQGDGTAELGRAAMYLRSLT
jgi:hypothetical protein